MIVDSSGPYRDLQGGAYRGAANNCPCKLDCEPYNPVFRGVSDCPDGDFRGLSCGCSSVGRAQRCQRCCRGFESHHPLSYHFLASLLASSVRWTKRRTLMSPTDTDPENVDPEDTNLEDGQEAAEGTEKVKLSLEVNVESPGACQKHVTVTVSRDDIDRYLEKAYNELAPKAEVPGFRPGRAPRKLVESRFKEQVTNQVKGSLLMDSLGQVSEEHEFSAISEPDFDFDAVTLPEDGPFTFEFDIEVRPEFDVPQWKGLQLERPVREYTDEDVNESLQGLLARYGKMVARDGGVQLGDTLDVDIHVLDGGKQVSALEDVRLKAAPTLSLRDASIDGFAELVLGAEKGEVRKTSVTITDGAENEAMRGRELEVSFKIREIKCVELPSLNAAFLETIGGFEDEDDLREAVRAELERQLVYTQQRRLREQITAVLTRHASWELPPGLVKRQARRELDRAVLELQSSGFNNEMIQKYANQIRQNSLRSTETALKEHFIFERIAEDQSIDADESDYDQEIVLIANQSDESPRRVRARLEKRGQMDALRNQIIERKVVDLICSEAAFQEVPLEKQTDDVFAANVALAGGHDISEIPEAKHGGEAEDLREPVDRS